MKSVPFLDFSRQYTAIRAEVLEAITEVCDSQRFILGPAVEQFEQAASAHCGGTHAVGCSSGTDALWLAMAALGIGPGDVVLTTPFSFFATVSSIQRAGARAILADIDPATFNLSAHSAAQAMEREQAQVRGIMPVHLYGQPADMTALGSLAGQYGALMVEDAAQAFGAAWNGVAAGALGDSAAFSFYPTKNLSAYGDAGLTTFRAPEAAAHARSLRAHGMTRRYYHDEVGWNARLDSIQAAVLSVKLKYIAQWNARRAEIAQRYDGLLHDAGIAISFEESREGRLGVVLPHTAPEATHAWHQYVIRIGADRRDAARDYMRANGVATEIYYPVPLHLQDALRDLGYREGDFPESERAAKEVLALPIYPEIREDELERVVEVLADFFCRAHHKSLSS